MRLIDMLRSGGCAPNFTVRSADETVLAWLEWYSLDALVRPIPLGPEDLVEVMRSCYEILALIRRHLGQRDPEFDSMPVWHASYERRFLNGSNVPTPARRQALMQQSAVSGRNLGICPLIVDVDDEGSNLERGRYFSLGGRTYDALTLFGATGNAFNLLRGNYFFGVFPTLVVGVSGETWNCAQRAQVEALYQTPPHVRTMWILPSRYACVLMCVLKWGLEPGRPVPAHGLPG